MSSVAIHVSSPPALVKKPASSNRNRYDPMVVEPHNPVQSEEGIWRSVIVQALMDAASNSRKKENLQWKEEALIWLRGTSKDFLTVCEHAGFEPEFVRDMAKKALERECLWRAAPGTGQKSLKNRERGIVNRHYTQSR